jgi:hypothetical protein
MGVHPARGQQRQPHLRRGSPVYEIYNLATGQIWWELHGVGNPAGPGFNIFPWPVDYTYGNCVAASNTSGGNSTSLVM